MEEESEKEMGNFKLFPRSGDFNTDTLSEWMLNSIG
jgi:hypothetical protein